MHTHTHTNKEHKHICFTGEWSKYRPGNNGVKYIYYFFYIKEAMCIMDIRVNIFKYINHLWYMRIFTSQPGSY